MALSALLAEHAAATSSRGAAAEDNVGAECGDEEPAATNDSAERAVWAAVELSAGNADVQDAVRAAQKRLTVLYACCR